MDRKRVVYGIKRSTHQKLLWRRILWHINHLSKTTLMQSQLDLHHSEKHRSNFTERKEMISGKILWVHPFMRTQRKTSAQTDHKPSLKIVKSTMNIQKEYLWNSNLLKLLLWLQRFRCAKRRPGKAITTIYLSRKLDFQKENPRKSKLTNRHLLIDQQLSAILRKSLCYQSIISATLKTVTRWDRLRQKL